MSEDTSSGKPANPKLWLSLLVAALLFIAIWHGAKRSQPSSSPLPAASKASEPYSAEALVLGNRIAAHITIIPNLEMTATPQEAAEKAFAAMREAGGRLSAFDSKSDVCRVNNASAGSMTEVSPLTWEVLEEYLDYYKRTDGLFDVTVMPLVRIYRESKKNGAPLPSDEVISQAKLKVGSQHLRLDREKRLVGFDQEGMSIDMGCLADSYAAQLGLKVLRGLGVKNALVECGGEVALVGQAPVDEQPIDMGPRPSANPGSAGPGSAGATGHAAEFGVCLCDATGKKVMATRPWRVGIRNPRNAGYLEAIEIADGGFVSSSGIYEDFSIVDGVRFSHIIDIRTGKPAQGKVLGATVVSPRSCTEADALALCLVISGEEAGRGLLKRFPGTEAYLVIEGEGGDKVVHLAGDK